MIKNINRIALATIIFGVVTSVMFSNKPAHADIVQQMENVLQQQAERRQQFVKNQKFLTGVARSKQNTKNNQYNLDRLKMMRGTVQDKINNGKSEYPQRTLQRTLKGINKEIKKISYRPFDAYHVDYSKFIY